MWSIACLVVLSTYTVHLWPVCRFVLININNRSLSLPFVLHASTSWTEWQLSRRAADERITVVTVAGGVTVKTLTIEVKRKAVPILCVIKKPTILFVHNFGIVGRFHNFFIFGLSRKFAIKSCVRFPTTHSLCS